MKKIDIFVTLGPRSLNKSFLKFISQKKNNVSLVRLNMSHVNINKLEKIVLFIKKNCTVPICIDTEGAQIRIKANKIFSKKIILKEIITFHKLNGSYNFYPENVFDILKKNDLLDVGFEGLQLLVKKKDKDKMLLICTKEGVLENNKGVHLKNRKINLNYITKKDLKAIKIAKKYKIRNFALSFTNSKEDILKFNQILSKEKKIYKIETSRAIKSLNDFFKHGKHFLIDRGDLSKDIGIENVPNAQRIVINKSKKFKNIKIAIATNFLESMVKSPWPTRAEVNDIYNSIEMGASSLVLAGETAVGNYPIECIKLLNTIIKTYILDKKKNAKKI